MKRHFKSPVLILFGALVLSFSLIHLFAEQGTSLKLVPPTPAKTNGVTLKLQVQSSSNSVIYVIQTSTNLVDWKTLVSGKTVPGSTIQMQDVSTTNQAQFFRLNELASDSSDTNSPTWTNGVGAQFMLTPPAGVKIGWNPATDDVGVSHYSIFVNGQLITNVLGSTASYEFTVNYQDPTDIRIQASDASGNLSPILSLAYMPGNKIAAVSDDSGRVFVFKYFQTNSIQTNSGFSAAVQIADLSGGYDRGLTLGDYNRDGIMDLVAGYASGNTLFAYLFKGLGDGTFAAPVQLPQAIGSQQGSYVMDMTAGDFDGDGNLDIVVNGNSPIVVFYWGNGDGTFIPEVKDWADTSYFYGRGMAAGDFNEDGREDIARVTYGSGILKVFLSKGDRTFVQTNLIASGLGNNDPYALAAGDFDEDGHLDLLVAGGSSGDVSFLKGFGEGTFTNITGTNGLWANLDIGTYGGWDAYDYNGDGHLDLVMGDNNGKAYFWPGIGDGTFGTNRVTIATGMSAAFGASAPPRPPRVDVRISPLDPVTNLNSIITFSAVGTGVSSNDFFRWTISDLQTNPVAWIFGAGTNNMGPTISHNYTNEGRFLTRLWHTTTNGINSVRGTWAIVNANPPVANPGGPYLFGSEVSTQGVWYATLNGSASSDDFGIVRFVWNFGDGTSWTTNKPTAFHGWPSNGVYAVSLTVFDAAGQSDTKGTSITFTNGAPPVAAINGPPIVDETYAKNGTWTATFRGTNSTSPVGIWQYVWQNIATGQTGNSSTFQTTWNSAATNSVTLTVTGNDSQTNTTTFEVWVKANDLPVPVIQGPHLLSVAVATNGLWFGAWNATNSTDDTKIYIYDWNYGDGSTDTGASVTHNYHASGNYPLTLTVTDNGRQSVTATQSVIVVAGNPPVAKIAASTLNPEGDQPILFNGKNSTSDNGIYTYTWLFPPRQFDFFGQYLNPAQWVSTATVQNDRLTVTGKGGWGNTYFFSMGTLLQRGGSLQGEVDTPSSSGSHAMVGLKNLDNTTGQFGQYPYAIYFDDGAVRIYENGGNSGQVTNYLKGTAYDFRIETKPVAGARYYLRPTGTGEAFALIYDSNNDSDMEFSFGADVYSSVWSFDNFQVDHVFLNGSSVTTPVYPGGTVTLQVVDNALLTNSTSVVVAPVSGTPPVAGINGPTNGQSGVQLAFDGYPSSDDHAIASYAWNFGDGSPLAFGPAVSHGYNAAGVYTNTLTVSDYARQSATAVLVVTVTGSNALLHVPWLIIQGVEQPHEIYTGKTNTLKAVARGISVPFTYVWNFGDGSESVTNTVSNTAPASIYNLEATHAYTGGSGTPFYGEVTVTLTNGAVMSDTYPLLLLSKTLDREMKIAIDEGLWYLQKIQNRYNFDTNTIGGDWTTGGANINGTASAVQSFAVNGHLMTDDAGRDPYVDTVRRGVNFLLNNLDTVNIGPQVYGDPDGNHNGIGLSASGGSPIYELGPVMDAFVAAARPELIAGTGGANVKGRPFKDLMQDMVDQYCWGQNDYTGAQAIYGGGWQYSWNAGSDNSACQWAAVGMFAAEHFWGIAVPDWVKQRNLVWLHYSSNGNGFGYTGPGDGIATTPSAMVQLAFDGVSTTNDLWQIGDKYLAKNWNWIMGQNHVYANYAIAKAMRTAMPQPVHNFTTDGTDWFLDPSRGLARITIDHQRADGSWNAVQWVNDTLASAWSINILTSSLFQQGPVAVINVQPNPTAIGYPTIFDARSSYHRHPGYKVVEYRWVFDSAKGIDFEHPDAVGPVVTNVFGSFSTNTVSLQVRDNGSPQLADISSVVVLTTIPPYPPTADAGGPYVACAGQDVHLDASGSFCVDAAAGNFIQSYDWEVYYTVPVTFNQGVRGVYAVVSNGYPVSGTYTIGLQVKNANSLVYTNFALPDETSTAFTAVYVYDRLIPDLKVRPKATKVQLTWTKAGDYGVIMRSPFGPDRGFIEAGRTTSSFATFLDTTIAYGTDYYYRIYAYRDGQTAPVGVSDAVFVHSLPRTFDEHAPQFQSTPSRLAKVGQLYEVTLDAKSLENQPMYFSLLTGPANLTVNTTSGLVNFTPTADQIGNLPLSFQVTNNIGRDVLSYTLFVFPATNHAPVAVVNGPYAALTGQDIQFSSSGSGDEDNQKLRYYWNFGDGTTSTNLNPVHAYGGIGDYLVTLYVNDGYGGTASSQTHAQITRPNVPPIAVVNNGPNFAVRLGETLALNGSKSYSPLGNPLTYIWLWGDGATDKNASKQVSHLYAAGGPYHGSLIVTDNKGDSGTNQFTVAVGSPNHLPTIVFTVSSTNPYTESVVTFDATGSSDLDGDPLTFTWDFGDRSKTTGPLVTHVFHQIQDFTVTVTVADNHGGVSAATQIIHALNAPPVFTSSPQLLTRAGTNYLYTPTVTDANGDLSTFDLVTGPVTMSCDTNTGTLNWFPGTNNLGPNVVVLRATDSNGAATDQSFTVVVTTPLGPQLDLQPTHLDLTNIVVDSQSLAFSGTVRVYLRNNGSDPVPIPFTLAVFQDADFDGAFSTNVDIVVGYGTIPAGFVANGSVYVDMTFTGKTLFKDAPLYAFVDSQNVVPEYNEANNTMRSGSDVDTNTPPVVDLSASYLQIGRFGLPATALLTARLGNSGLVPVPTDVPLAFYDGDPLVDGQLIGVARSTNALAPGHYQDLSVSWSTPTITNHTVFVVADDPGTGIGQFQEMTLSNNTFSVAVDFAAVLPPLAYAGPNQNVNAGDTVSLNGRDSFDPQGRDLTYRWSMLSTPIGSRAKLNDTNTVSPSFVTDIGGLYSAQLVVNNGIVESTNTATVTISAVDTNANHYPKIVSKPSFQGMSNVVYTYVVMATDEDGDALTYSLAQFPPGMTISANGLIRWTPTKTGTFFIQASVYDSKGAGVFQSWSLTILPYQNLAPQFSSTPVLTGQPKSNYVYAASATDANNDAVTFALLQKPSGMTVNGSSGLISWIPTVAQVGGNPVRVTANDGKGGVSTQSFSVAVFTPGQDGPIVQPFPDQIVVGPKPFATIPLDPYVFDPNDPKSALVWTVTGTSNLTVTIDSNRVATLTYAVGTLTSERLTFLATDPSGKSGFASAQFTVRAADNPPVAALANLSDTTSTRIETGLFDLKGTAEDPDVIDPVAYRVTLYDADGFRVADVTPVPINAAGWHEGRVAAGGNLGTLDFTAIQNGGYTLMLEVRGGDLTASVTASIAVDSNLKLGQFAFSQQDAVIGVGGAPIRIVRTYNSLNLRAEDFGYSWAYAVSDLGLTINEQRMMVQDLFGESFSLRSGGGRDVTLDMPDTGRRVTFRYAINPGNLFKLRATWTPPPGINASLVPTVSANMVSLFGLQYWEAAPIETGIEGFDFPGFTLTLEDGTQYRVDRENLGEHYIAADSAIGSYVKAYGKAFLTRINDSNGEHTDLLRSGAALKSVDRYSATGQKLKTVLFQRDAQNRIAAVYTPENLDTNGAPVGPATVTYEYDGAGNLTKVKKLMDSSNPSNLVYAATTYIYGHARFPHYITEIRDPRGVPTIRTEYDDQGRVIATVDGLGNRTEIQHDLSAKTETVYDRLENPTVFAYDDRGNVVAEINAVGGVTRRAYDANNYIAMEVDPLGHTNLTVHDSAGNVLSHTDPLGNTTANSYDASGRLLTTTDPLGRTTSNTYDSHGNLLTVTDPAGNVITSTYDASNNRTSVVDAAGKVTQFAYDRLGNVVKQTDSLGNTTTYAYDANGYQIGETNVVTLSASVFRTNVVLTTYNDGGAPISSVDVSGSVTRKEFDAIGNTIATVDAMGHRTEYRYDERSQLIQTTYPDGTTSSITYDDMGRRDSATDRVGHVTRYGYDALGRLTTIVYPAAANGDLPIVHNEYDAAGRMTATIDEMGNRTSFAYDASGRQIAVTNALGLVTTFAYDAAGHRLSETDPKGNSTFFLYDNLDRLVRTVLADGTSKRTTYDVVGHVVAVIDQADVATSYEYDVEGRLTAVVDPLNQRTEYTYNEVGNLVRQHDANGHETRYERDPLARSATTILPLGQRSTTFYNPVGKPVTMTNYNSQAIRYEYDVNNQVSAKRLPNGGSVEFAYSPTGRRQTMTDARGVTRFIYDARNRLLSRVEPDGRAVKYEYDLAGNRTRLITCTPPPVICSTQSFAYDALNRLQTVTAADGGVTSYIYDSANNIVSVQLPNGTVRSNTYDVVNRLSVVENRVATNVISTYRYTLDTIGNRVAVQELNGRQVHYAYDAARRLVGESVFSDPAGRNRTNHYDYDAVGNRLSFSSVVNPALLVPESVGYAYDDNDQLLAETNFAGGDITLYIYDSSGNTLSRSNSVEHAVYSWSAENRLAAATITDSNGVHQLDYQYNPDGIRVSAAIVQGGSTNRIVYLVDGNRPNAQVLEEWTSVNGQPAGQSAAYTYGLNLISQNRAGARSFYHADGLNSTRALTDDNGLVTDEYDYDAFGRTMFQTGDTENSYQFAGQQRDKHLGLDYLRARYMEPSLGRFYGRDPATGNLRIPSTRHPFIYGGNDPVNYMDPSGRQFDLVSVSVSLSINSTLEKYQVAFAKAGSNGIKRSARIADHVLRPAYKMQELGFDLMAAGKPGGAEMFSLGSELEQMGYRLLQSAIAGIYVETFNTAKIDITIGPLKIELGMVSGSIGAFGKKAEYGAEYADYAKTFDNVLKGVDDQIKAVGLKDMDTKMSDGATKILENCEKLLDKISDGPDKYGGK